MKREKFLWPLTQGHHRGLVAARNIKNRIEQMKTENRQADLEALKAETEGFWKGELQPHFEAEEEMLQIFAEKAGAKDKDLLRTIQEHRTMTQLLKMGFKEDLLRFAEILTAHIRFEEEVLFGRIEKILTPEEISRASGFLVKKAVPNSNCIPRPEFNPPDPGR